MKMFLRTVFFAFAVVALCGAVSFAQTSGVDTSFNAVPSNSINPDSSNTASPLQQIVQTDGKVIIWGASLVGDGIAKGEIMRLNTNGSVDQGFSYCGCDLSGVENVALQPNGQLIAAGSIGQAAKMIRLNSDGSLDPSFVSGTPPNSFGTSVMRVIAIQPDGKILAYRRQSNMGFVEFVLYRFNQDGSLDSGFTAIPLSFGSPVFANIGGVAFLPDGRFYLALTQGNFGVSISVKRYNSNGTVDSSWEAPNFPSGFGSMSSISGISLEPDGSLLVAGKWDTVNGLAKPNLIRLLPAGNIDVNFSPSVSSLPATGVESLPGGKILYSQMVDIGGIWKLFRLNSDGTPDNTFTMDPSILSVANKWVRDASGNIIFLALINAQTRRLVRLFPDGALDASFNPNVTVFGTIHTLARQADGKVLAAGMFSQMNGVARPGFARVDSSGNPDPAFDPGTGFSSVPSVLVIQSDGKILAAGSFSSYNGVPRSSIARINPDGSLDASFAPVVSGVEGISLQSDGKTIISGSFTTVNGTTRTRVARLEASGALDTSFNTTIGSGTVSRTIVQPDGKIMISGSFTGVNGFNRSNLARLNADGSLDQTFNATGAGTEGLWRQPDGKYITATQSNLARRNADGSNDNTFVSVAFSSSSSSDTQIHSVLIMADGSLIVGGRFDTIGGFPRRNLARLKPNGELDSLFLITGANNRVRALIPAETGKILIGGDFTKVENTAQPGISRLIVSQFRSITPFDFDGDGKADVSVFRPSENKWYILRSSDFGVDQPVFAVGGDRPIPSDYDGDGKTDVAIFRPSSGDWWYRSSFNNAYIFSHWGNSADISLPSDFDGDGRADYIVFRSSSNTWYRASSANGVESNKSFGLAGDKPVIGDFDGDGKSDVAIYRPSTGTWWYQASSNNAQIATQFGIATDVPVPADYDGDGTTDFAVYRPATGGWYILNSSTGQATIAGFGLAEDKPVPADYDGDGRADIAVFRPSTGVWYLLRTTDGFGALQFGVSTDIALPNAFIQ